MTLIASSFLVLLFLGMPFYWGAFGHNGFAVPMIWALIVTVAVNLRRWRHFDVHMITGFVLTLVVSLAACSFVFAVGRFLSR